MPTKRPQPPSRERVSELLKYDPITGRVTWAVRTSNRIRVGDDAGTITKRGYRCIRIDGVTYQASNLIWLIIYGEWPAVIDHANTKPADDWQKNLRVATVSQNMANKSVCRNNQSGSKGVYLSKEKGRIAKPWVADIRKDKKTIHLGRFATQAEASAAYREAAVKYHGEFARF